MRRAAWRAAALVVAYLGPAALGAQRREMAVTVDDLPFVPTTLPVAAQLALTDSLLAAFRQAGVPAIGFVNESKVVDSAGRPVAERVALLERWLGHRFELGNHTWSHLDLHRVSVTEFTADLLHGETITRPLALRHGLPYRYFRHPYLHTGRPLAVRDSVARVLLLRGYRVAPVTVDNADYVFARAYQRARDAGDGALATRLEVAYLDYMDAMVRYWEAQARAIVGRDMPHVLLIHASALNAHAAAALLDRLHRRGYQFIPLDQALADPAYRLPDRYDGPAGISWIHRWAITRGTPASVFAGEPAVPGWVEPAAGPS